MGNFEQTPIDEISGLPLLLVPAPDEEILPYVWGFKKLKDEDGIIQADWNHVWHPAREVVDAGDGGPALRSSRVQMVLRRSQHDEYHAYFSGPPQPSKPSERFRAAVLCAAGYIPPQAIAFGPDGPYKQDLTDWQKTRLRESGEVRVASISIVQKFLRQFVVEQPVDHIKPQTINRFLKIDPTESTYDSRRHAELAYLLLSLVIDKVEDPLITPYSYALDAGLLAPGAPRRLDQFVLSTIASSTKNLRLAARELTPKLHAHREKMRVKAAEGIGRLAVAA